MGAPGLKAIAIKSPALSGVNMLRGIFSMEQDAEGNQILEVLGRNMAWLLKAIDKTKHALPLPERTAKIMTSFIR